ncbi:MAG: FAD-binding oxidoreductase [Thermomicrobiales bacterium]|nr:FAD-binding oxidoreductase [Thermomicrobiales bacterium]
MTSTAATTAITELRRALGEEKVSTAPVDLIANGRAVWPVELKQARRAMLGEIEFDIPACVVRPGSTDDVCTVLRIADELRVPVIPYGGGSGIVGGTVPPPGSISLDTKALNHIDVDPVSMIARVGAGCFGIELETALNSQGFTFGHYPQSLYVSTVGGWIATRASGTFSTLHGNIEDRVIGLDVVLPGGKLLSLAPSPRSATGPDLKSCFIGSEGAFGVITAATLELVPTGRPRLHQACVFPTFQQGLDAVQHFIQAGARPAVVRLYDSGETAHKFANFSIPAEGAMLLLIFEGTGTIIERESEVVEEICRGAGGHSAGAGPVDHWWQTRFDTSSLAAGNCGEGGYADAIEVSALWGDLPAVYASMLQVATDHGARAFAHVSHVYQSGACLYVIFAGEAKTDRDAIDAYQAVVDGLLASCLANNGAVSHHHGVGRGKARSLAAQHGPAGMEALTALKQAFDPHNIMNPGVLGLGEMVR